MAVVESTPDSSTNADKPLYPTVINKEVKEGENGTLFIEIKFHGTSKTEIFVYVNGKVILKFLFYRHHLRPIFSSMKARIRADSIRKLKSVKTKMYMLRE